MLTNESNLLFYQPFLGFFLKIENKYIVKQNIIVKIFIDKCISTYQRIEMLCEGNM